MFLIVMLPVAIGIVGVPMRYAAPVAIALTVAQLLLIGGAAYGLAGPAWRSGDENRRRIVIVAMLLILPFTLLTLMPGYGPPFAASLSMNRLRYVILFVSATFMSAAFLMLKDVLADAGERPLRLGSSSRAGRHARPARLDGDINRLDDDAGAQACGLSASLWP
ncbi:hypothetical protein ACRAWD_04585 [Caulobacter segnis]